VKPKVSRQSRVFVENAGVSTFSLEKVDSPVFFVEKHGSLVKPLVSRQEEEKRSRRLPFSCGEEENGT